jgi:two-component system, LytTR family, sensor histidine kinase AlgZ
MHPIFARGSRLTLYLATCLIVGGLLSVAITRPGGLSLLQAAAIVLPLAIVYGFVCLSSWYVCRATPLRTSAAATILVNVGGSAIVASMLWLMLGRGVAWAITMAPGFAGVDRRFADETLLLFVVGVLLYLLTVAANYVLVGVDEARAVEQRALEVQLLSREAELKALRAQIEPHFLFNALNSISALTTQDPAAARRMCLLLSDFLRSTLSLGSREKIPLAEELGLTLRFFEIEQVRFGTRLRVEQVIDQGLGECQVPPLLLQPLAENAVRHGIADLIDGGTVRLEARRHGDAVRIVLDNPYDQDRLRRARSGVGLDNVRRRLATHYGGRAGLEVDATNGRFQAAVTLPASTP